MGLDMNMYREYYTGNKWKEEKDRTKVNSPEFDINEEKVTYITEEIGDWRKFNALHGWIVKNVQNENDDCGTYYIQPSKLRTLLDIVQKVQKNHQLAATLLPATPGFFFGYTGDPKEDYDDYYFENLDYTEKVLLEALDKKKSGSIKYSSSW